MFFAIGLPFGGCLVDLGGVLGIFQYACRLNPEVNMFAANILPIITTWHV